MLLAISDRYDDAAPQGSSFQTVETIAAKARMSERNARRVITQLEERGKLRRHERPSRSTCIELLIPDDFGRRKGRRSKADNLAGSEDHAPQSEARDSAVEEGRPDPDNLSGSSAEAANLAGKADKLAPKADKLAADSSPPNFPTYQEKTRARASSSTSSSARTSARKPEESLDERARRLGLERLAGESDEALSRRAVAAAEHLGKVRALNNSLRVRGLRAMLPGESLDHAERRLNEHVAAANERKARELSDARGKH